MSVAIMNMALDFLEEEPILTAEDDRTAVRWMNRNFQPICDSLLRVHPWNFAIKWVSLAELTEAGISGFKRKYQLPADFIRLVPPTEQGALNGPSVHHRIEGKHLAATIGAPMTIQYVSRVTNESEMDPMFTQALAATLAARAASFITGKNSLAQTLQQLSQQLTQQAQMVDSLEGTPYEAEADDWISARFGDYGRSYSSGAVYTGGGSGGGTAPTPSALPPTITTIPVISGSFTVGSTLSVSDGTWNGSPTSFSRQWYRSGVAINGATSSVYAPTSGDTGAVLSVVVIATNSAGIGSATAVATAAVTDPSVTLVAPAFTTQPAILGTPVEGQVLTAIAGTVTGTPDPTTALQWKRNSVAISGATGASYTLAFADIGATITVTTTATNAAGTATASSPPTNAVEPAPAVLVAPSFTAPPVISGSAVQGNTLTTTTGTSSGSPTPAIMIQWRRGGVAISGANGLTYVLTSADVGFNMTTTITATNSAGSASSTSATTAVVASSSASPVWTVTPVISGTTTEGQTLNVSTGTVSGTPTPTRTYQWARDGVQIPGATGTSYLLVADDVGKAMTVFVTATNTSGAASITTAPTAIINAAIAPLAAPAFTSDPSISGTAAQGQTLTSSTGTVTGNPTPTTARQWKRNGVAISGATGSTYVLTSADVGAAITITVTATNSQGSAAATSTPTGAVAGPPTLLSSPNQTATSGIPFSFLVETSEPCTAAFVGSVDDLKFDVGSDTTGAVAFDYLAPIDVGTNNVYDATLRITSLATNLSTDIPVTVTVIAAGGLYDFTLSSSSILSNASVGAVVGDVVSSGASYPTDFTLSNTSVSSTAAVGTVVGNLS